jgi:hypothetical protein
LFFADGGAVKKAASGGRPTETLAFDNHLSINRILVSGESVFVGSGAPSEHGIFKVSVDGGILVPLLERAIGDYELLAVQGGYVYFKFGSGSGFPTFRELHRVPLDGGAPELVFSLTEKDELLGFEAPATAYANQWIFNDQYALLMHNIGTGLTQKLWTGSFRFLGFDASAIYINDSFQNRIRRLPKDLSPSEEILVLDPPLSLGQWLSYNGDLYFNVSYLDDTGVTSAIARMRPAGK